MLACPISQAILPRFMPAPLANYLAYLRASRRKSQDAFGKAIGLAGSHVCIIEGGKRYAPLLASLAPLIAFLKLTTAEIEHLNWAAEQSPRHLRVDPSSPEEAFRFAAKLQQRWNVIAPKDFDRLSEFLESLGTAQPYQTKEAK